MAQVDIEGTFESGSSYVSFKRWKQAQKEEEEEVNPVQPAPPYPEFRCCLFFNCWLLLLRGRSGVGAGAGAGGRGGRPVGVDAPVASGGAGDEHGVPRLVGRRDGAERFEPRAR